MLNNFILCLNGIAPIFLLVLLGSFLNKAGLFDEEFSTKANNLVFKVSLPSMIFYDIATCDIAKQFDTKLVSVAVVSVILMFFITMGIAMLVTKDDKKEPLLHKALFVLTMQSSVYLLQKRFLRLMLRSMHLLFLQYAFLFLMCLQF